MWRYDFLYNDDTTAISRNATFGLTEGLEGYTCSKDDKKDVCKVRLPNVFGQDDWGVGYSAKSPGARPTNVCK